MKKMMVITKGRFLKTSIAVSLLFTIIACSQVDKKAASNTQSETNDLLSSTTKPEQNLVIKTERVLRKLRMATALLSSGFNTSTVPLSNVCKSLIEENAGACSVVQKSSLQGLQINTESILNKISGTSSMFETLQISNARESLYNGEKFWLFDLKWELYKDSDTAKENKKLCSFEVENIVLRLNSITNIVDHLSLPSMTSKCDLQLSSSPSDDSVLDLSSSELSLIDENFIMSGSIKASLSENGQKLQRTIELRSENVTDPVSGEFRKHQCSGTAFCWL